MFRGCGASEGGPVSAECYKHGCHLVGTEFSPGGLRCPQCDWERRVGRLEAELKQAKHVLVETYDELLRVSAEHDRLRALIRSEAHGRIQTMRGVCSDEPVFDRGAFAVALDVQLRELDEVLLAAIGDLEPEGKAAG